MLVIDFRITIPVSWSIVLTSVCSILVVGASGLQGSKHGVSNDWMAVISHTGRPSNVVSITSVELPRAGSSGSAIANWVGSCPTRMLRGSEPSDWPTISW